MSATGHEPLLAVRGLRVEFRTAVGLTRAVNGVDFTLERGETLAILGESGSGKSVSAQAIMRIIDSPPGKITGGTVRLQGEDLLQLDAEAMRAVRGNRIAMVFQDAQAALDPAFTVGQQIAETLRSGRGLAREEALARAIDLMERVQIPDVRSRAHDYPHQFSGGMAQRVMIAMALALEPEVLIADEPTTALDVTVQAQVMQLLAALQAESGMGLILITHDLGVVAEVADRVAVMYAGKVVETGPISPLRAPGPPLHRRPDGLDAARRPAGRPFAGHSRLAAQPDAHPRRLRLSSALRAGAGALSAGDAGAVAAAG